MQLLLYKLFLKRLKIKPNIKKKKKLKKKKKRKN